MNSRIFSVALVLIAFVTISSSAEAKHHYRHYGGGSCDGIHRCRCGTTAANEAGLPWAYKGLNLKRATEWKGFAHASFANATHAVWPHHVAKLVGGSNCSNATVHDERGTYPRNVCGAVLVNINGGVRGDYRGELAYSGKRHFSHRDQMVQYASSDYITRAGAGQ